MFVLIPGFVDFGEVFTCLVLQHFLRHSWLCVTQLFLPSCFKRAHMMSCYWEYPRPMPLRHDPSRPYAEQYRIDARQFANLFQLVSPWTCGIHTEILAERTFRLLDDNMDQLMEFKAFVSCLGTTIGLHCKVWHLSVNR